MLYDKYTRVVFLRQEGANDSSGWRKIEKNWQKTLIRIRQTEKNDKRKKDNWVAMKKKEKKNKNLVKD